MNKYFNKGLLYQWFNSAKASIFLGIIVWGMWFYSRLSNNLESVKYSIADGYSDSYFTIELPVYFVLGIVFIAIYYMASGTNKRNTITFLSSGPYTKKQIKYNEFIGLILTLILFVICSIYISGTFYIRNREILAIVNGYINIIGLEVLKIILFGIVGILFMLIVDCLFSNSIIAASALLLIIPESIVIIFYKVIAILRYIDLGNKENIFDKISYLIYGESGRFYISSVLMEYAQVSQLTMGRIMFESLIVIFIIAVMFVIFNISQRRYKLENCNKIFSSRMNENIVLILSSIGGGILINVLFIESLMNGRLYANGTFEPLSGANMIYMLGVDIFSIAIAAFIIYKIAKRILNKML